ncbi:hypothetical protein EOPP23_04265 [Endozoicomonas sp. OPT23]|nr:hypothetical protein [Endozoicomonas sp. OPT23]
MFSLSSIYCHALPCGSGAENIGSKATIESPYIPSTYNPLTDPFAPIININLLKELSNQPEGNFQIQVLELKSKYGTKKKVVFVGENESTYYDSLAAQSIITGFRYVAYEPHPMANITKETSKGKLIYFYPRNPNLAFADVSVEATTLTRLPLPYKLNSDLAHNTTLFPRGYKEQYEVHRQSSHKMKSFNTLLSTTLLSIAGGSFGTDHPYVGMFFSVLAVGSMTTGVLHDEFVVPLILNWEHAHLPASSSDPEQEKENHRREMTLSIANRLMEKEVTTLLVITDEEHTQNLAERIQFWFDLSQSDFYRASVF